MPALSALLCLVCGFERGGTTALSEVLRQAPGVEAGFEGGFLLARDPMSFPSVEPYYGMALRGWNLALEDMDYVCSAPGWEEMYRRLAERFRPGERVRVFDKTPRYMERLAEVMAKVPGVPVIVVVRDPRALFWSWLKRAGERPADWLEAYPARYHSYAAGYRAARRAGLGDRLLLVRHEDLSLHPEEEARRIFSFLGLDFDPAYLSFAPRFRNVRGEGVTSAFVLEYRDHLTAGECEQILEATAGCADWWWKPPEGFAPPPLPAAPASRAPVAPRSPEEKRRRRWTAAKGRGGPECFAARVAAGGLRPLDAVLDLSAPFVAVPEQVAAGVEKGRYRRLDWEARLRAGGPERPLAGVDGRFDLVTAHSLLPFLSPDEISVLLGDVASVLAPSGRFLATLYLDEAGQYPRRPMPQARGRSFPNRAPYHLGGETLRVRAAAAGLAVIGVEDIEHPSGQRLVVLGRLSEAE
jgi:SAM-dependent methyltransferase